MKEAIVEFNSLPKKVKDLEGKSEKKETLKKLCRKRKVEMIHTEIDEEKWKIKVNFNTDK